MRRVNNKGAILIVSFWIMAILSIFAVILTSKLSFQIKLMRNRLSCAKAFYVAKAGVERVLAQRQQALQEELKAQGYGFVDSFKKTWFNSEELFKDIDFGEGKFSVKNAQEAAFYGMSDENAKVNINSALPEVLKELLKQTGLTDEASVSLAASIVAWRKGNSGFDAIEEILLVDSMTSDIFSGISKYITVYGNGKININTAPGIVLNAVLGAELSAYIISVRQSGMQFVCGETGEDDDKNINSISFGANPQDETMLPSLTAAKTAGIIDVVSSVFRVNSFASVRGAESSIEAIAQFDEKGLYDFISWAQK